MDKGLIPLLVVLAAVAVSGCTAGAPASGGAGSGDAVQNDGAGDDAMAKPGGTAMKKDPAAGSSPYTGYQQLAPHYYRYDPAAFRQAQTEGKAIFLFFRANWCPLCTRQQPKILAAFSDPQATGVIGFEAHYNDDETTADDTALAQQYQVPYQDTKIFLKADGSVSLKTQSHLETSQILAEFGKAAT